MDPYLDPDLKKLYKTPKPIKSSMFYFFFQVLVGYTGYVHLVKIQ